MVSYDAIQAIEQTAGWAAAHSGEGLASLGDDLQFAVDLDLPLDGRGKKAVETLRRQRVDRKSFRRA